MVVYRKKIVLLSVVCGVILSALVVGPGMMGSDQVVKKVPTTHKVVSL